MRRHVVAWEALILVIILGATAGLSSSAEAQTGWTSTAGQADGHVYGRPSAGSVVRLPEANTAESIEVSAQTANRWQLGEYDVWVLKGNCRISQGDDLTTSDEAVLWIDRADEAGQRRSTVAAYLEGRVRIDLTRNGRPTRLTDSKWLGEFKTDDAVNVNVARVSGEPQVKPAIYQRGTIARRPTAAELARTARVEQTQFAETIETPTDPTAIPLGTRRVRVFPRSNAPVQAQWFPDPNSDQWIAVIDSGVNLIVDGIEDFGAIDVSTDRLVIWTTGLQEPDLTGQALQDNDIPLEIYMEGNIVFRQGERVIHANRMYYDVQNKLGTVIDAELLTPVPNYEGLLRLHAKVIEQTGENRFFARDAFLTSSRMGRPGYRIQSGEIFYEDVQQPVYNPFTQQQMVDPVTGQPIVDHQRLATSQNNVIFLGEFPVFYWPTLATNLEKPNYYINALQIANDDVFGTQVRTGWDAYQLFGFRSPPDGTEWDLSLDYLSDRGWGHGTTFVYNRDDFLWVPGRVSGLFDFWGIKDSGFDNLGRGWRHLQPETEYRHRMFWQHRQMLAGGDYQLSAELGWISDRNFLNQYFENEWDELKDQTTGLELKALRGNRSWSVTVDGRLNSFFTQTEWLPRLDHFWLGQPLVRDRFTWYEHSQIGYAQQKIASTPEDPAQAAEFTLLPWETPTNGERLVTRQEIDYPFQLGVVKFVPFALGEFAHWGENLNGEATQRLYGQAGVRASMPMWKIDPTIQSEIFNLHGLAHKIVYNIEFAVSDANRDMNTIPLLDPLNDDSIEAFERRFAPTPTRFDPRYYALRTGMGGWVTAPSTAIADDLMTLRMGMRHRWQTKRGMPGNRRIMDWVVFDTNFTLFPKENRDNFGKMMGLWDYDVRWHIGDRTTLVSDGIFDFFDQGQSIVTIGGFLNRPPRGSIYAGVRILEGPISSHILSFSYNYHMSPKWISSFGMSVDVGGSGNIGQNFRITRIGESLLVSAGFNVDSSRDNVGVSLAIEPRFLPKNNLGRVGGAWIPVAGAHGLE